MWQRPTPGAPGVVGARSIRDDCPAGKGMTMSKQLVRAATARDPYGWRAGAGRVLANALLVLLAFEVVTMVVGVAEVIVRGATIPVTPAELLPRVVVFVLVRWIFVLPGLLAVLVGIEYVARRAPHARVLTAVVAFAPMVWWALTQSSGGFSAVLGVTAVLFALLARLPARFQGRSTEDRGPAQPPAETAVAPR